MLDPADASPPPDFRTLLEVEPGRFLVLDQDFVVVAVTDAFAQATGRRREDIVGKSIFEFLDERELPAILQRREAAARARVEAAEAALQRGLDEAQRFAYLAAHDLQSPLHAISGCVRLLEEECRGKLGDQAQRYMGYVLDYTQRAQTLIRDLLAYSRLEAGTEPGEPTSLAKACAESLDLLGARIGERGAEVVCGDLPTLRADRNQMIQLFGQLIDNAIKFNRADRPRVQLAAERRGEEWLLSVSDNGIGIDPCFHSEIFEIFRRLHSAQAYPGSGIGLAVCQRIVARHGGRIWVESQPGAGSTFFFTLPVDREAG